MFKGNILSWENKKGNRHRKTLIQKRRMKLTNLSESNQTKRLNKLNSGGHRTVKCKFRLSSQEGQKLMKQ